MPEIDYYGIDVLFEVRVKESKFPFFVFLGIGLTFSLRPLRMAMSSRAEYYRLANF